MSTTYPSSPDGLENVRDRLVVVPPPTRLGGLPAVGWARIALALRSLSEGEPAILTVEFVDESPMVIDWGRSRYWWVTPIENFPATPRVSRIRLARGPGVRLPFMREEPVELEPLLWFIGRDAFADEPAWWLSPDSRYRLERWPNLTEFAHHPDQVRMIAQLSTSSLAVDELAAAVRLQPAEAQVFINTLSLMGLLSEEPIGESARPDAPVATPPVQSVSLFARLRARLGR